MVRVIAVVVKVTVFDGSDSARVSFDKNTSAKLGAGTFMEHVTIFDGSHETVCIDSEPCRRPSMWHSCEQVVTIVVVQHTCGKFSTESLTTSIL